MIPSLNQDTIIAQCSPMGSGAVALLRISGPSAFDVIDQMSSIPGLEKISLASSHTIHYGWVIDSAHTKIDQVLFLMMRAPKTFTGEHTVEITCHNNQFLIEAIISRALECGARIAQNGEFTRQAFLNSKIDLLQAEAINELIHAGNHLAIKQSLSQLNGSFSHWMNALEKKLINSYAYVQASFEFLDEELEFGQEIKKQLGEIKDSIERIEITFDAQQHMRQGVRIALIGSVNAGKSSLFNALIKQPRAIVADIAGTTRDSIEYTVNLSGVQVTFIDTAGLRTTDDSIEAEGIRRSHQEAHKADIILFVIDGSCHISEQNKKIYADFFKLYSSKIITLCTKADLPLSAVVKHDMHVSEKIPATIATLQEMLSKKISQLFERIESPFLLNQRHFNSLQTLKQQVISIQILMDQQLIPYEIIAEELQTALAILTEVTGKTISEEAMDAVFREFCVGK